MLRYELGRERQTCRKLVPWTLGKASTMAFMGSIQYAWDSFGFSTAHSSVAKCSPGATKRVKHRSEIMQR